MTVSDYIVEYLIKNGITDVYGYPGGMVTHLMESLSRYKDRINAHVTYHEQGAAFAACGYAQVCGKTGVAYATSGSGATNLVTGICNAFFDSIPVLFITGQVNTFESKNDMPVRQRGFQETDIVSMVKGVTKYAVKIDRVEDVKRQLEYAFAQTQTGRKGPVLLDIPMNILRAEMDLAPRDIFTSGIHGAAIDAAEDLDDILEALKKAKRPVLLLGNGIKTAHAVEIARKAIARLKIPTVSTMLAVDIIHDPIWNYGFIGAYGHRSANFIVAKSDLILSLGARLDVRQIGFRRHEFAPRAALIRVDIDESELAYRAHEDEKAVCMDVSVVLQKLSHTDPQELPDYREWVTVCKTVRSRLSGLDDRLPNKLIRKMSPYIPDYAVITTDVGQNQVWVAQSLIPKTNQRVFFSGGHGAMGYSLPAAIGCSHASREKVICFCGDGGIQMNIQELQTIARERLPIKIVLLNNYSLGMIRHFQEMYFRENYTQTIPEGGYTAPDFSAVTKAYGINYYRIDSCSAIKKDLFAGNEPALTEVAIEEKTYVFPKLEFGKPNQEQEPLLDRKLYDELMAL